MQVSAAPSCPSWYPRILAGIVLLTLVSVATSCGGGSVHPLPAQGNTTVTLLLSSTANDQLSQFGINLTSLSLTTQSGKSVSLFTASQNPEFIHLNGKQEPLLTATVPQDTYTAANIVVGDSEFTCVTLSSSGGLVISTFANTNIAIPATVNLPAPITVAGSNMALSLNLQVPQSATFPSQCAVSGLVPFSITPTFNLTAVPVNQVIETEMHGKIVSVDASHGQFTLALAGGIMNPANPTSVDGQRVSFLTNSKTAYQGLSNFSALSADALVEIDALMQADGSQLATRVSVADSDLTNLSTMSGALLFISSAAPPTLVSFGQQNQGYLWGSGRAGEVMPYSIGSADFQIADVANLQDLPFVPSFSATNMFAGQRVYVSSHATALGNWPDYFPANTLKLIPQTINGTITGIGSSGNFTTYNVALASYELMPALAVQPGQTTTLTDPSHIVVYVDSHTRRNAQSLNIGGVARFNGLLFNDAGVGRMDCLQVDDGVAAEPVQAQVVTAQTRAIEQGTMSARIESDRASRTLKIIHQRMGPANR